MLSSKVLQKFAGRYWVGRSFSCNWKYLLFSTIMVPRSGDLYRLANSRVVSRHTEQLSFFLLLRQCKNNALPFFRGQCDIEATKENPFLRHPKVVTVSGVVRKAARMARVEWLGYLSLNAWNIFNQQYWVRMSIKFAIVVEPLKQSNFGRSAKGLSNVIQNFSFGGNNERNVTLCEVSWKSQV